MKFYVTLIHPPESCPLAHLRRWLGLVVVVLVMMVSCGPSRSGHVFSLDTVRSFTVGKTTKADVRAQMGEPQNINPQTGGMETWLYHHTQAHMTGTFTQTLKQDQQSAIFVFNGDLLADLQWQILALESKGA